MNTNHSRLGRQHSVCGQDKVSSGHPESKASEGQMNPGLERWHRPQSAIITHLTHHPIYKPLLSKREMLMNGNEASELSHFSMLPAVLSSLPGATKGTHQHRIPLPGKGCLKRDHLQLQTSSARWEKRKLIPREKPLPAAAVFNNWVAGWDKTWH